jgi:F0F1-type ATP synthase membrane subunit b/b'
VSFATVINAAIALRETHDAIEAAQKKKSELQTQLSQVNSNLDALRVERDTRAAALKAEVGTI